MSDDPTPGQSIPKLRNKLKKLEKMRKKSFDRWNDYMDGAWGQDPHHPLLMKQEGRREYRRYLDLDAEINRVRKELIDKYKPINNDLDL